MAHIAVLASRSSGVVRVDDSIGVLLICTFISFLLTGMIMLQLHRYLQLYPTDRASIKAIVWIVTVLEIFHTILPAHTCYYYLVSNYNNLGALLHNAWSISLLPVVAATITIVSQVFFARRVWLIGTSYKIVAGVSMCCLLASLILSVVMTIDAFRLKIGTAFVAQARRMTCAALALASGADYLLSSTMIIALRRSRAVYPRMHTSNMDQFTLYAVNTGLLTGCVGPV